MSFEDIDGIVALLEPAGEDAVPHQSLEHVEPMIGCWYELAEPPRKSCESGKFNAAGVTSSSRKTGMAERRSGR